MLVIVGVSKGEYKQLPPWDEHMLKRTLEKGELEAPALSIVQEDLLSRVGGGLQGHRPYNSA